MNYIISFFLLYFGLNLSSETFSPNYFDAELFSKFAKDFVSDYKKKTSIKNNDTLGLIFKRVKHAQYIDVSSSNLSKIDLLNEFMAGKIYQYLETINLMTIPEFRLVFESSIKILKYDSDKVQEDQIHGIIGSTSCKLEKITNSKIPTAMPVCSWHWIMIDRVDKYPFRRALAKCNCIDCQAKTIFDSERRRLSGCMPNVVLMPVLFRDNLKSNESTERWWFALEEIPTSCICSLRLKPIKK